MVAELQHVSDRFEWDMGYETSVETHGSDDTDADIIDA